MVITVDGALPDPKAGGWDGASLTDAADREAPEVAAPVDSSVSVVRIASTEA